MAKSKVSDLVSLYDKSSNVTPRSSHFNLHIRSASAVSGSKFELNNKTIIILLKY